MPPTPGHVQVNHIDGSRSNNAVHNLQYVTPAENVSHSYALGRRSFSKPVLWRRVGDTLWNRCDSMRRVERELGVPQSAISKCLTRGTGRSVGFEFKFAIKSPNEDVDSMVPGCSAEQWKQAIHPKTGETIKATMVSTLGRIFKSGRTSFGTLHRSGYYVTNGKAGWFSVHRLIAATFLGPPSSMCLQVNHIDGNRSNNSCSNLEYVTPSENVLHALSRRRDEGKPGRSDEDKPVFGCRSGESSWVLFSSISDAAQAANVSTASVVYHALSDKKAIAEGWSFRMASTTELPGEVWRDVVLG
ncbi:yosQ [Symbiodinium sp. CCMP2456]|nr:yosQ [Symbiodinium sp. CCMP2456]